MTTAAIPPADVDVVRISVSSGFLEALARQDFNAMAAAFTDDAAMLALVPGGLREAAGPDEIGDQFRRWFGDTTKFQLIEAVIADAGPRLRLNWRIRLQADRLDDGWMAVEQQAFVDPAPDGRFARLRVLCSGYYPEN